MGSLGYPVPSIIEKPDVNEVWLTLPLSREVEIIDDPINDPINSSIILNDLIINKGYHLSKLQLLVLGMIINNNPSLTYRQPGENLGIAEVTVKRTMQELKKQDIISRSGSNKTGKWVVRDIKYES